MAKLAAQEAHTLSQAFSSIEATATALSAQEGALREQGRGSWSAYHAGMAIGLSGRMAKAETMFQSVRDERVRSAVARIAPFLGNQLDLRREADKLIAAQRNALGLSPTW